MGHIYVKATFYNAVDYIQYLEGKLELGEVRRVEVEALVDRGATFPALPKEITTELALLTTGEYLAETAQGGGKVELAANALIKMEDKVASMPHHHKAEGCNTAHRRGSPGTNGLQGRIQQRGNSSRDYPQCSKT